MAGGAHAAPDPGERKPGVLARALSAIRGLSFRQTVIIVPVVVVALVVLTGLAVDVTRRHFDPAYAAAQDAEWARWEAQGAAARASREAEDQRLETLHNARVAQIGEFSTESIESSPPCKDDPASNECGIAFAQAIEAHEFARKHPYPEEEGRARAEQDARDDLIDEACPGFFDHPDWCDQP